MVTQSARLQPVDRLQHALLFRVLNKPFAGLVTNLHKVEGITKRRGPTDRKSARSPVNLALAEAVLDVGVLNLSHSR